MDFDPSNPPADPYVALGVSSSATQQDIKTAYRALARTTHPDKAPKPELKDEYTEKFQKVQQAYELLTDEDKKREYDDLKRLTELRDKLRERHSAPRTTSGSFVHRGPPMRTQTFYADNLANGSGPRFEERRPKGYYDDEDLLRGGTRKGAAEFDAGRRSSAGGRSGQERVRTERVGVDKETEERRRKEKLKDQDRNRSRNSKYEAEERYASSPREKERERERAERERPYDDGDRLRRKAENAADKYDTWFKDAQRHQSSYDDPLPKPSVRRDGSSYDFPRRSQATPRERSDRERDVAKLAELKRAERELREKRRAAKSVFPEDYAMPRRGTEPLSERMAEPVSPGPKAPSFQRSESMPTTGSNASPNTSTRRKAPSSKEPSSPPRRTPLRETQYAECSDHSSDSSSDEEVKPKYNPAKPVKATAYKYSVPSRDRSRSRDRDLPRERRRSDDARMPRAVPIPVRTTRSPARSDRSDRERERERDREDMARREAKARMRERARERDAEKEKMPQPKSRRSDEYVPLSPVMYPITDRTPSYSPQYARKASNFDVNYAPNITKADVRYGHGPADVRYGPVPQTSHRRNASSGSGGAPAPGLNRYNTMPVHV
jgi:curved DNA-binding protein CbpA